ncbi:hypothetical protein OY671_010963, partial [Metschnikowia pulcherrima]
SAGGPFAGGIGLAGRGGAAAWPISVRLGAFWSAAGRVECGWRMLLGLSVSPRSDARDLPPRHGVDRVQDRRRIPDHRHEPGCRVAPVHADAPPLALQRGRLVRCRVRHGHERVLFHLVCVDGRCLQLHGACVQGGVLPLFVPRRVWRGHRGTLSRNGAHGRPVARHAG